MGCSHSHKHICSGCCSRSKVRRLGLKNLPRRTVGTRGHQKREFGNAHRPPVCHILACPTPRGKQEPISTNRRFLWKTGVVSLQRFSMFCLARAGLTPKEELWEQDPTSVCALVYRHGMGQPPLSSGRFVGGLWREAAHSCAEWSITANSSPHTLQQSQNTNARFPFHPPGADSLLQLVSFKGLQNFRQIAWDLDEMHGGKRSVGSKHGARIRMPSDCCFLQGSWSGNHNILHDKLGIGNWELGIGNREL